MNNNKNKLNIIVFTILIGISLLLGIAYAFFNYTRTGPANQLVVGEVYLNYTNDSNALSLTGVEPRNSYDANNYIEFTISGLNEHKSKDLWYAIDILHGNIPTGKTETNRIRDDLLRFRLTKKINNNEEEVLLDNKGYADLDELRMFVETIPKETEDEISHTYRLYMWISDEISVGNTQSSDYTITEWNNLFASIKVRVVGDFIEKENTDFIKVNFDANGGKVSQVYRYYEEGDTYGTLPVPVREGYRFLGWEDHNNNLVTSSDTIQTTTIDVGLYNEIRSSTMYKYIGEKTFNGTSDYIDTGISLFSEANWQKNFYVEFYIKENNITTGQATLFGSKSEADTTNYPGFVLRRNGNENNFNISANVTSSNKNNLQPIGSFSDTKKVKLLRIKNVDDIILYYSFNDDTPTQVLNYKNFTLFFNDNATFGAAYKSDGTTVQRFFKGTLSNMLVEFISDDATLQNYENYIHNTFDLTNTFQKDITLTAKWERDVMNEFPEFVTNNKENITKIYFKQANQTDLGRYESATLKGDIATEGSVKTWLETDPVDNTKYIMYVESETPTYLTSGYNLFKDYTNLTNIDFSNINTSEIESMNSMFHNCSSLRTLDLKNFDTSNVNRMASSFQGCSSLLNVDMSSFDTSKVTNMSDIFDDCSSLVSLDVSNFNTGNVRLMNRMFQNCSSLASLDVANLNFNSATSMINMFKNCSSLISLNLGNKSTGNNCNVDSMFQNCSSLTSLDVTHFDTSKVTTMQSMFADCSGLTSLDVTHFNTGSVANMRSMFQNCSSLTSLDVTHFNTGSVANMRGMFHGCSSLTSLNLSSFNTSAVTTMQDMFNNCNSLTSLNLSNFNTSAVTNMDSMFERCKKLISLNLSSFDTSNVTDMLEMFRECYALTSLDLSSFNTINVTKMGGSTWYNGMFTNCYSLERIYVSNLWTVVNVTNHANMFHGCNSLVGEAPNNTYPRLNGDPIDKTYAKIATDTEKGYLTDISLKPSS